jgi:hypothetical protein
VGERLRLHPEARLPTASGHTVIVLVGSVHHGVLRALAYAQSLRPQRLIALSVVMDDEAEQAIRDQWQQFDLDVQLDVVHSPYRELVDPVMTYIDGTEARHPRDLITVIIPEFVVSHWYEHLLHNQSALFLKGKLLFREGVVVTSVPYHLDAQDEREVVPAP